MIDREKIREHVIGRLVDGETLTRPALARALKVRPATLFEIIDGLKADGVALEPDRPGKRTGRRASGIRLNAAYGYVLGVDFKPWQVAAVAIDLAGAKQAETIVPIAGPIGAETGKQAIAAALEGLRSQLGADWKKVLGLGFADPGAVDTAAGVSLKAVNIPGWQHVHMPRWFRDKFNLKSLSMPSPGARARLEYQRLAPRSPKGLFLIEFGVGVGGAFVKNGALFSGDTHYGMEIGHIVVSPGGALCQCGSRGCLETVAGRNGVRRAVAELAANGVETGLSPDAFSITTFVELARSGDKAARSLAYAVAETVGTGLAAVVTLLNPSAIVFCGDLAALGDLLIETVGRTLATCCMPPAIKNLELKVSALDERATAEGAALVWRDHLLKDL